MEVEKLKQLKMVTVAMQSSQGAVFGMTTGWQSYQQYSPNYNWKVTGREKYLAGNEMVRCLPTQDYVFGPLAQYFFDLEWRGESKGICRKKY